MLDDRVVEALLDHMHRSIAQAADEAVEAIRGSPQALSYPPSYAAVRISRPDLVS